MGLPKRKSALIGTVVLGTLALSATAPALASPPTAAHRLSSGVTLTRHAFSIKSGSKKLSEVAVTLDVRLSSHTSLVVTSPGNRIGAPRLTLAALAKQEKALAGVSGDVFYRADPTSVPRGGFSHRGVIVKSALQKQDAVLWTDTSNRAHVGDPGFTGSIRTAAKHVMNIHTENSLENARNGAITVLDSRVASRAMPSCFLATFVPIKGGGYQVRGVFPKVTRFTALKGSEKAFMSCGSTEIAWMKKILTPGVKFTGSWGYAAKNVSALLSGPYRLVRNGKVYRDPTGIKASTDTYQNALTAETFACVTKDASHVLLGTILKGKSSAGMTYAQLGAYMVKAGCWQGITLDAGKDSTLVAKLPGKSLGVQNAPAHGAQKLVNGLLVVTS